MTHEWKVAVGVLWISGCAGAPEATCSLTPDAVLEVVAGAEHVRDTAYFSAEASSDPCGETLRYTWSFTEMPEPSAMDTVVFPGNGTTEAKSQAVFFDVGGRYGLNVDVENAYDLDSAEIQFDMAED